jgi:NAD(P)-dependent dehydrogenase (short-subunit alcohol dehydrogenase family)
VLDDLTGKVALVTGASRGIGRAIAVALAQAGADVAVNYQSRQKEAEETCAEIEKLGRRTVAVQSDVSIAADVTRLVTTVEAELGHVAILVNNAGVTRPQPIGEITEQDWDEIIAVNLKPRSLAMPILQPATPHNRAFVRTSTTRNEHETKRSSHNGVDPSRHWRSRGAGAASRATSVRPAECSPDWRSAKCANPC